MSHVLDRPFFNLAVIRVDLSRLMVALSDVLALSLAAKQTSLDFPSQPYSFGPMPMLFWAPKCAPELTAFMPRVSSGDYFVVSYACKEFGFAGAAVRSSTQQDESPINEFAAYEANRQVRFVRAMKDDPRWEFYTEGQPLPFEDESAYTARRFRDRFQREALLAYLEQWGAPVRSPEFWLSDESAMTLVPRSKKTSDVP